MYVGLFCVGVCIPLCVLLWVQVWTKSACHQLYLPLSTDMGRLLSLQGMAPQEDASVWGN